MARFTDAEIADIKARNPIDAMAGRSVRLRVARGDRKFPEGKSVGPCPFCSKSRQSKTDSRFECDGEKWVCGACADGGDVIHYVAREKGLDPKKHFGEILAHLGGVREIFETPESARRRGRNDYSLHGWHAPVPAEYQDRKELGDAWFDGVKAANAKQHEDAQYRERERSRLYLNYWKVSVPRRGTPVERYLCDIRKVLVPDNAVIRYMAECPYFDSGSETATVLHTGPAMLCAIFGPDPAASAEDIARGLGYRFSGLHFTWLDLDRPKGKIELRDPQTGELLPAKKSRGTKQGGYIDLGGCRPENAHRVVAAEGNENTLTGYTILMRAGRDVSRTHFRGGIDLGNLSGKALDRLKHPTLKTETGRARLVPGNVPDLSSPAMPIPRGVRTAVWMCDGDSDTFTTRAAMQRAETRNARDDLKQVMMWPADGSDWNDKVR